MAHRFASLLFTEEVKALQERFGSRESYRRLEEGEVPPNDRLGAREAGFIAARDSFLMASVSSSGWPYVQHRGGPPGFLKVLGERLLGFADFSGNRQYVSAGNLLHDDRVALILLDHANRRRLKLLGRARIAGEEEQPDLAARLRMPFYTARIERAVLIEVEAFDWNCPQHITPRFTAEELEKSLAPVRERIAALERENAALRQALATAPA
ncbi:pyridoxamine 5'-phosphate oxidase family protein [Geminicoccaceae bacterium 1502E]|nr:pyridoxamine 5'-phosphate oxidase family protein [Geminicoccaceae bacterium 1502E]